MPMNGSMERGRTIRGGKRTNIPTQLIERRFVVKQGTIVERAPLLRKRWSWVRYGAGGKGGFCV